MSSQSGWQSRPGPAMAMVSSPPRTHKNGNGHHLPRFTSTMSPPGIRFRHGVLTSWHLCSRDCHPPSLGSMSTTSPNPTRDPPSRRPGATTTQHLHLPGPRACLCAQLPGNCALSRQEPRPWGPSHISVVSPGGLCPPHVVHKQGTSTTHAILWLSPSGAQRGPSHGDASALALLGDVTAAPATRPARRELTASTQPSDR